MWQNRNQQRNRFFLVSVDCFFCSILFRFFRGSFVSLGVCVCLQMNPKRKRPQKEREEKVESVKDFFLQPKREKKETESRSKVRAEITEQQVHVSFVLRFGGVCFFFTRATFDDRFSFVLLFFFVHQRSPQEEWREPEKKRHRSTSWDSPIADGATKPDKKQKKKQKKNGFVLGVGVIVSLFVVDVHLFHRFFSLPCVCYFCRPSSTPIRCHTKSPLPLAVLVQFAFGPNWLWNALSENAIFASFRDALQQFWRWRTFEDEQFEQRHDDSPSSMEKQKDEEEKVIEFRFVCVWVSFVS